MNHITTKSEIDAMMKKENKEDTVILNLKINKPLFNDKVFELNKNKFHFQNILEKVVFNKLSNLLLEIELNIQGGANWTVNFYIGCIVIWTFLQGRVYWNENN